MKSVFLAIIGAALALPVSAADLAAGEKLANTCMACHGENGVSISATIPNIAAQKPDYIVSQLKAFKSKKRENALMNAIAAQLSPAQMEDVAAYFSARNGASNGEEKSAVAARMTKTNILFPADYKSTFSHYTTINFENRKQVRDYLANDVALAAAREGRPMPEGAMILVEVHATKVDDAGKPIVGSDGFFERKDIQAYTAMAVGAGWGQQFPELLRNGDWHYAVFKADGTVKPDVSQGSCLACHKPLESDSFVFTLKQLREKAAKM